MKKVLQGCIRGYQKLVSPYIVRSCRYEPSCSEYAHQAVDEYGAVRGTLLAIWRIMRCNPWVRGGYDPVVKSKDKKRK